MSLSGKVCLVTGATRGIGKGIALQLGEAGATVYITGRTMDPKPGAAVGGSIKETIAEIEARGGRAIGVQCDHKKDEDVKRLFEQIQQEQNGRLDLLVNNAYSAVSYIFESIGKKFWELDVSAWDEVNNVGLRNHYICSVYASRMMVERGTGLIVNISSAGGLRYLFNVPYGVGKAAVDRLAGDMAVELKSRGVAAVSLWPGAVQTEEIMSNLSNMPPQQRRVFEQGETVEFAGKAIVALASTPVSSLLKDKTGRVLLTGDLADEYCLRDAGNRQVLSMRSLKFMLSHAGYSWLAGFVPTFPKANQTGFIMSLSGKVCLVTGATRGIGKGIAIQLGQAGAIVYVTGRTLEPVNSVKADGDVAAIGGSIKETVAEIKARGGQAIGVQCDHRNDEDVKQLFEQIEREQNGRLDLLVNNAFSAARAIAENRGKMFWEMSPDMWDEVNNVGLRNHYICSVYASRMMVERGTGLIINVSSGGGLSYLFNVPYGVGKAAFDRMAADMSIELKSRGVAVISLWPGAVQTEEALAVVAAADADPSRVTRPIDRRMLELFRRGETTDFVGKAVTALAAQPVSSLLASKTGRVLLTAELASEYGFSDVDGRTIVSMRSAAFLLEFYGFSRLSGLIPACIKVPFWLLPLTGLICLVTGATRGIGKGIALQLGEAGATVYITGRTMDPKPGAAVGGSIKETIAEIEARGGRAIGVQCDHKMDEDVKRLFEQIQQEQNGRLDLLVNNAYSAVRLISESMGKKFWELDVSAWDEVNNVGLRNHYICSVYASRMMVERGTGLIVNLSSPGGLRYLFNVPYGVGKAALDRMAGDFAVELKPRGIAAISLWPGAVQTEEIMSDLSKMPPRQRRMFEQGETVEFAGKAIVALASTPVSSLLKDKTGRVLLTGDLADEYGLRDAGGRQIQSMRSIRFMLEQAGFLRLARLVPTFVKVPRFFLAIMGSKF
uniref:Dehydrogenase/reductase SDR family member 1 n=1 Tax=Macrostomum lignano TaxID=282301 RepID=A0A1I8HBT8_9PLAT